MINSLKSLEFLKSKSLAMDKYSSTTTTKLLPSSSLTQVSAFGTISDCQNIKTMASLGEKISLSKEMKNQDRVIVQHGENHTNLQNNKLNTLCTFYNNISASSNVRDREMFQVHQTKPDTDSTAKTPLNIQNKSAFHVDFNNKYHNKNVMGDNNNFGPNQNDTLDAKGTKKNLSYCYRPYSIYGHNNKILDATKINTTAETQSSTIDSQRTEDQYNAYRHIESVHNYAKSKLFEGDDDDKTSPTDSRHSSFLSDDDEEDEDNDGAEYDNDDNIDYEDCLPDDLYVDYKDNLRKREHQKFEKTPCVANGSISVKPFNLLTNQKFVKEKKLAYFPNILKGHKMQLHLNNNQLKTNCLDEEDNVDVETIEPQLSPNISITDSNFLGTVSLKPDHHARRPMNAFLIFCKRHRAIVKDRYKNLENRAITKILGDWWASLDSSEKICFTNLAQQNKDAFFSANPNFKWYKLPAPPLRTLTTRPANTFGQECQEDDGANGGEIISNISSYNKSHSNYFKLADEAQMGDLSQLMQNKSKTINESADLQKALSETSKYMTTHITCKSKNLNETLLKRRFYNENSFSSNSSEEDIIEPKKKSARSCKGKRYQELINSGQIITSVKKAKSVSRPIGGDTLAISQIKIKQNCSNVYNFNNINNNDCQKRSLTASENIMSYDINSFDLEEKIKELPALSLDDYLQRKRNPKKKKKLSSNGKKKGQRGNNNKLARTNKSNQYMTILSQYQTQAPNTAVGSQKRKARKESITRRNISVIEQEVASLLALNINGCCYFQEAPTAIKYNKAYKRDSKDNGITSESSTFTSLSSTIIPVQQNSFSLKNSNMCNTNILNDNISSSTSDLLILAEVAANSTELKH